MSSKEIVVDWQAVKTDVNDRKLPPGTLVRRKNTFFDQDGKISKRNGYDLTEAAGTGGSFGGPATEQLCADELAVRVGGDQIYERSGDALLYRGRDRRCRRSCGGRSEWIRRTGRIYQGRTSACAGIFQ